MKLKFSDRIGKTEPIKELRKEGMTSELVNSLWSIILDILIKTKSNDSSYKPYTEKTELFRNLWINFFKLPIDTMPTAYGKVIPDKATKFLRDWFFFKSEWYEQLNLIEFLAQDGEFEFRTACNVYFQREFSAYRFIEGTITEVNSEEEIVEIEKALTLTDRFLPVRTHLKRSIELLSDKTNPDYRNSIKESISAVESLAKILTKNNSTTLGQALKVIEDQHKIPGSLKSAFGSLYGFTSDKGGIRHALLEKDIIIDFEEARFMLIACSAFINYLLSK